MKLDWGGGGGVQRKNPFHGGGMDNFWNHTIKKKIKIKKKCLLQHFYRYVYNHRWTSFIGSVVISTIQCF